MTFLNMTLLKLYAMLAVTVVILSTSHNAVQGKCTKVCEHKGHLDQNNCTCKCQGLWEGDTCDTCTLNCLNDGCRREASCFCDCKYYWRGNRCEKCSLKCVHGELDGKHCLCECYGLWTGDKCDICSADCFNGGSFHEETCSCTCPSNVGGPECQLFPKAMHEADGLSVGTIVVIAVACLVAVTAPVPWVLYMRRKRQNRKEQNALIKKNVQSQANLSFLP
ncbi:protein delta homolog 1-like isoform X2 [Gigantopelta aegis]|uniref:protein delta homolog 1-like isoform X2 n=1 Tax=Gigantopelta aegis TaxID=1735272 RepID=UPI001B88B064|nr:protein delta homolog 1-like isoform X2 [Gigantopelta aegis]